MLSRSKWLDEGLDVLAVDGLAGLRTEGLARRLQVTRGSFYHHFVDLADYRRALLGHYEETCTREQLEANGGLAGLLAVERLRLLSETALSLETVHSGLEAAIRGWAVQDDDARQTLGRVDAARLEYLQTLITEATGDLDLAHDLALMIYYTMIGSQHAEPRGTPTELRRLWNRLLAHIPTPRTSG